MEAEDARADAALRRWPRLDPHEVREAAHSSEALAELIAQTESIPRERARALVKEWLTDDATPPPIDAAARSRLDGPEAGRGDPRLNDDGEGPTVG